jgi:predicted RNase H-like HicB family nuclease
VREKMPSGTKSKPSKKPSRSSRRAPRPEDYQVVLHWSDEDQCYIATIPAWQHARTHGATLEEASLHAHEVLTMLIRDARRRGEPCPEASTVFSGNLRLRLPVSLHGRLAREAEREGVSLNQWIVAKLAG